MCRGAPECHTDLCNGPRTRGQHPSAVARRESLIPCPVTLRHILRLTLPANGFAELNRDLERLASRVRPRHGDIWKLGERAEREPPRHVPVDAWGGRVDRIEVSDAWRELDRVAAEEGIVATGYERRLGDLARLEQMARLFIFHPASAMYSCPLAMSDGAARVIELHGDPELRAGPLRRLTSRDPADVWTSGQWMTETAGGSDVAGTATVARYQDGEWRLYGEKWFASSTTSQIALVLARAVDGQGADLGLSVFLVEPRDGDGVLRDIRVERLKDKLGTRALPTAELTLNGVRGILIGEVGRGVRTIAPMLSITRMYNTTCAAASMRHALLLARDYSASREAFGRRLHNLPAHAETLAAMEVECSAALHLAARVSTLLGRAECGTADAADSAILRLLVPVAKLYTGKQAVAVASEAVECFGGAGYVEDTGIPRLLRDAQVLSIWEGTTNVLAVDTLRALNQTETDVLGAWMADVDRRATRSITDVMLGDCARTLRAAARRTGAFVSAVMSSNDPDGVQGGARGLAFSIARISAGALMLDYAQGARAEATEDAAYAQVAVQRWCRQDLAPLAGASPEERDEVAVLLARM